MRSSLHRSNFSIAARIVVMLLLVAAIGAPILSGRDAPPTERPPWERPLAAMTLKVSTDTARPGQRIGIVVETNSAQGAETDVVLIANGQPVGVVSVGANRGNIGAGRPSHEATFEIEVPATGPLVLGAELRDQTTGTLIAAIENAALVNVASTASVLIVADTASTFGQSLRQGGWPVIELRPNALPGQIDSLASTSLLVLDNIAADDLPETTWARIEDAVRREAMGLLVLGGPRAFGLGGYRDSRLENILPVVSEPPDDEPPASLMFLIDVSGSMDRPAATSSRLQVARQAVVESSRALRPMDHVGLMTYDVAARERLPLAARAQHANAIEQSWPESASGGTSLAPAMLSAIDALEQDSNEQKILVVLTDGYVTDHDLKQLGVALASTDIEIISLIIESRRDAAPTSGRDAPPTDRGVGAASRRDQLTQLIEANNGRAIRINDVLQLPTLMRNEVERRRPAVITGPSQLTTASPAAWLPDVAWPSIDQYLLTRPRNEATVHIVGGASGPDQGDAIIANWNVGAGKVVAVTSGFSSWTRSWLQSDSWPAFAADLTRYLATRDSSQFDVSVQDGEHGEITLVVDLAERQSTEPMVATLVSPSAAVSNVELEPYGPGQLMAQLQLDEVGQYLAVLEGESGTTRHRFLSRPSLPVGYRYRGGTPLPLATSSSNEEWIWQRWLTVFALFGFLLLLWWERK